MPVSVTLQTVHPRKLATVRREVALGEIGSAWGPALGKVWPTGRADRVRLRLEVARTFETAGEVYATERPAGKAAVAIHRGPYHRMNEAHDAIRKWMAVNRRESAGHSWEIYGDPTPDRADTEMITVVYLWK